MLSKTQYGVREDLRQVIAEYFDLQGWERLGDAVFVDDSLKVDDLGLYKASQEAYYELDKALKRLTRLGVRMGYIEGAKHE